MDNIWFSSWGSIIKILIILPVAYISLVILLRVSGKRSLSKMNAFDLVVTIALGSVLASVSVYEEIALANGICVFLLLILLQFLFTWLSVRVKVFQNIISSKPTLLFYQGNFVKQNMIKERITEEEVYSVARQKGLSCLDTVDAIILETTGDIAIVEKITDGKYPLIISHLPGYIL